MGDESEIGEFSGLFGSQVVLRHGAVTAEAIDMLATRLTSTIESMSTARAAEFATGRMLAHRALGDLGCCEVVDRGPDRQPVWPSGFTGSITHTKGWCLAAVAPKSANVASIGVDAEIIDRVTDRVARRVLIPDEQTWLAGLAPDRRPVAAATIFAAKEAFYKAHHQLEPRYLGFDAVSVSISGSEFSINAQAGPTVPVSPAVAAASRGRRLVSDGRVVAAVTIPPPQATR